MEIQLSLAAVPLSIARPLIKNWNKKGLGPQVIHRFLPKDKKQKKNAFRLYLPIEPVHGKIVVPKPISMALAEKGFSVDDYITGIAVDKSGKRRMRIGKIIKDQELLKEFMNDPQRAAHKDDFTCVISCHPYDVLTMSTGRRWDETSCMRLDQPGKKRGGANQHIVKNDIAEGTLVAYAISPEDTNINKPHARLLIKPFYGVNGGILFRVESSVYGTPIPGFKETISRWLRQVNASAAMGYYKLQEDLYDDGVGSMHLHGDFDAIENKFEFFEKIPRTLGETSVRNLLSSLFKEDKRWLGAWIKNSVKLFNGEDAASYQIARVYLEMLAQKATTSEEFGKALDENMNEHTPYSLLQEIVNYRFRDSLVEASERLTEEKEEMVFNPDYGPTDSWVLEKVAYYDSRWLSLLNEKPTTPQISNVIRCIISGSMTWTQEWQDSKLEASAKLFQIVGVVIRMLGKATKVTAVSVDRSGIESLNDQFKNVDVKFDAERYEYLERNMRAMFNRYVDDAPAGLLCAIDNSWPSFDVGLIVDAGRVILEKDTFESLLAMDQLESDVPLFNNLVEQRTGLEMTVGEFFRTYPWTRPLFKRVAENANTPKHVKVRAERWVEDDYVLNKKMDDILSELEG